MARIDGYGDAPLDATAELGERVPTTVVAAVSDALIAVHHATEAP